MIPVVAVGASAGGLEAFGQLLDALPPDLGMAFVLVSHLSPRHQSSMAALLTPHTTMPVAQVREGVRIEPNRVYVIPPDRRLHISGQQLHLEKRPGDRTQYTPIDGFFSSLAAAAGSRAIGIVLSGTASDGAVGVRDIKAAGGLTLVQSPASAKYDGMPRAAIATGMVDVVQPPDALAATLAEVARHSYAQPARRDRAEELAVRDDQLTRIFELLKPVSGVDFRHYKLPTIKRRLLRRMALNRLHDVAHYLRVLEESPAEVRALYQDLLIHVTRFFRDPDAFRALATMVFPRLLATVADRPVRAWVSGCATGEEAYSLAIEWLEYCRKNSVDSRIQIFATDVSENAIDHARAGLFAAATAADVTPDRLRRYFTRTDGSYRVTKAVRDLVVFARQDLTRDPPFSRLDLVLCRNVLIYLDAPLQRRLISMFHYALNPQGYLMLGQAETVGSQLGLFTLVEKKSRLHRKKAAVRPPAGAEPARPRDAGAPRPRAASDPILVDAALQGEVNRVIFDRYAPPGVVVDADLQVTQFRGQTGMFLEPAPGEPSLNLLKMLREGLLHGVRAALQTARRTRESVRKEGLEVRSDRVWTKVAVEVVPLAAGGRAHFLILFEPDVPGKARPAAKGGRLKPVSPKSAREQRSQLDLLQRELAASREYLQSIIQELEAANEELQSANEEILSSNEELQSTNEELDTAKEELQSTNEELNTVNEQLQGRNEELTQVNSDLVNLVASVQIAIVIVGRDLRIRRFTPMAEKLLNLIPGDVARSITHINTNLDCPDLEALIGRTMDEVTQVERDIQSRDGHWFSLRIRPYKDLNNKIDGAVLALFDIDLLKRGRE